MKEFEILQEALTKKDETYKNDAYQIISDFNNENGTKDDYRKREIFELLQNADDAYSFDNPNVSVKIEIKDNILIIQNTGIPFSARGINSLMHTNASSKYEGTIGCKGLGFRAVLNWAYKIMVCTKEFKVLFSEEHAKNCLKEYRKNKYYASGDELERIERTAILAVPEISKIKDEIKEWLDDSFSTSIVLFCYDKYLSEIEDELSSFQFEELLFLKHINHIEIIINGVKKEVKVRKEKQIAYVENDNNITEWKIWKKSGKIELEESKKYEMAIAYPTDLTKQKEIGQGSFLFSFFKTEIPIYFPFLIHSTFDLTSERNGLIKDSDYNREVLDILIDFIIDIGLELRNKTVSSYDHFNFLIPKKPLNYLNNYCNFEKNLYEKISEQDFFPTINNKYISVDEKPKYSNYDFDKVLNPQEFYRVLKKTTNKSADGLMKRYEIKFYNLENFVELINQDFKYYYDKELNAYLIYLIHEQYLKNSSYWKTLSCPNIKLFLDSNGQLVDDVSKVYFADTSDLKLPAWYSHTFLNESLKNELKNILKEKDKNADDDSMCQILEKFGVKKFTASDCVDELISDCSGELDKTKDVVAWIFANWKNKKLMVDELSKGFNIISTKNEIVGFSECYIGKEHGNLLGNKILSVLDNIIFVGTAEQNGLKEKDSKKFLEFLEALNLPKYPKIIYGSINENDCKKYIEYNLNISGEIPCQGHRKVDYDTFRWCKNWTCSTKYVDNLQTLLEKNKFNDIICWMLHKKILDENVRKHSYYIEGKIGNTLYKIQENRIISYIQYVMNCAKWIPVKDGGKEAPNSCIFSNCENLPLIKQISFSKKAIIKEYLKYFNENISEKEIENILNEISWAKNIEDLPLSKVYEILNYSYENNLDTKIIKSIYNKLLNKYKFLNDIKEKIYTKTDSFQKFSIEGKILATKQNMEDYYRIQDVYLVDKDSYFPDLLNNYVIYMCDKKKIKMAEKLFCLKTLQIEKKLKSYDKHPLSANYKQRINELLPYIYVLGKCEGKGGSKIEELKNISVTLAKSLTIEYSVQNNVSTSAADDYKVYDAKKQFYIKIPESINNLKDLENEQRFENALIECFESFLSDDFANLLIEKFLQGKHDVFFESKYKEYVDELSEIKKEFSQNPKRQKSFFDFLGKATSQFSAKKEQVDNIMSDFNYNNYNDETNLSILIELFQELEIDIEDFNKYSDEKIQLEDNYISQWTMLLNQYKNKYFYYILENGICDTKKFKDVQKEYEKLKCNAINSVYYDIKSDLEENLHLKLSTLDTQPENYENLLKKINLKEVKIEQYDESDIDEMSESIDQISSESSNDDIDLIIDSSDEVFKTQTNYKKVNKEIEAKTNSNFYNIETIKPPKNVVRKRNNSENDNSENNNSTTTTNKNRAEDNGYKAESKVYNTILSIIKDEEKVKWASHYGAKAGKNASGRDGLGYDIVYVDNENIKHYVEVKGSTQPNIEFILTRNEYEFAIKHYKEYEIWYVPIEKGEPKEPYRLVDVFKVEDDKVIFNIEKFNVNTDVYKISSRVASGIVGKKL